MDRTAVRSTNIIAAGWEQDQDSDTGTLEVEFKQGIVYQYADVPEWVYKGLVFAQSPGKYFNQNILDAYDGQRIA